MDEFTRGEDSWLRRIRASECAVLVAVGLVAFELAMLYPSSTSPARGTSWRDKDWLFWYNAHQLYRRDPDDLTEWQFENVKQWCRCSRLVDQYTNQGLNSLTEDECLLVVETLEKLCPHLEEHKALFPVYEACRRRLQLDDALARGGTR